MPLVRVSDPRRGVLSPAHTLQLARRQAAFARARALARPLPFLSEGRGLGDCGPNPCTWSDYLSFTGTVSPACLLWQQTCSAEAKAISASEQNIGQNIQQSIETSAQQTLSNLFGTAPPDPNQPPTGTGINWVMVGLAALAGVVVMKAFSR